MDYKKLYLEQKQRSLQLEMNLIQMRAGIVSDETAVIEKELMQYVGESEEPDADKT